MCKHNFNIISLIVLFQLSFNVNAQLGFCSGNSGDPIFTEDFGTGIGNALLTSGTTTYTYANGRPLDGFYTISNFTGYFSWFDIEDHTPNDTNGRLLLVNADNALGEFFKIPVFGLCEKTTYEFSSWMLNLVPRNPSSSVIPNPNNVTFEVWDNTETTLLAFGNTGDIPSTTEPVWREYGLVFQTFPGQTSIVLRIVNNGDRGYGNDLALDDIEFKACGDTTSISDGINNSVTVCSTQTPYTTTLDINTDGAVYGSHFYQWQESTDGVNWLDIPGETNQTITVSGINSSMFYRTKVAEVESNLSNAKCFTFSDIFEVIVNTAQPKPTLECWETATFNDSTCAWEVSGVQPQRPSLDCWETASFNNTTCAWEVTGSKPIEPVTDCWQTATFNTATCVWEVTGSQPPRPSLECWESANFNVSLCAWEVIGSQPIQPVIDCWETAIFNNTTCTWEVSGTQPVQPVLECWESASFNTSTCSWQITGTQPIQPVIDCWETAIFNNTTCTWEVSGTQPVQPVLECWESASFNTSTCSWEVTGSRPTQPVISCWETATFNNNTCIWEVTGTQPVQPVLECWETAVFNDTTCSWEITGSKPHKPIINCWQTTAFNENTCVWDVVGDQPDLPALECWETATFNNNTCSWDVSGHKPERPDLKCWETTSFNETSCVWDIIGAQPTQPTLECWETAIFDPDKCAWEVSGRQPDKPVAVECWETVSFNTSICDWEITGAKPLEPSGLGCWQTATFDDTSCSWNVTGIKPESIFEEEVTLCATDNPMLYANSNIPNPVYEWSTGAVSESITISASGSFSVEVSSATDCVFETINFEVTYIEKPIIERVYSDGNDIIVQVSDINNLLYSIDGRNFQYDNVFYDIDGGEYTIHVKNDICNETVTATLLHFYVPKFFTPNNDGYNDTFNLKGLEVFGSSQVSIFDRYGKLLKNAVNIPFEWDGNYNSQRLPTGDYWYVIVVDGRKITGHVTLKR